jgi:CheY-like chemotaxis protein
LEDTNLAQWRVIVVDDEPDSADIIEQLLELHGITEIASARNGAECMEIIYDFNPDIIVVDLSMPQMDGWQTLRELRGNTAFDTIPVIAMTAYHSLNVALDAKKAGFDAYFTKPIDVDAFINTVIDIINTLTD